MSSSTKPTVSVLEKSIVEACEKVMTVLIWFVLTDLSKIPLTMSIENCFPPVPVTEAPVPDESDHVLAFGCVDLGYAYVRDTKENVRRRSSRRSSVDVEAPSGAAAEGVVSSESIRPACCASMASSRDALAACKDTSSPKAAKGPKLSWLDRGPASPVLLYRRSSCIAIYHIVAARSHSVLQAVLTCSSSHS